MRFRLLWPRWLLAALIGGCAPALAVAVAVDPLAQPSFETVGQGQIPRDVVATAAQDRAGFIWIATGDGLVRYDGYRFQAQERRSADPTQRNLGWVQALLPTRDGRLWIGTESDGLMVHDPRTDRITPAMAGQSPGPQPTVMALAENSDGSLWIGSMGGGLERFDPATGQRSRFQSSAQAGSLPDNRVVALLVDRQGTLWVGSWQGLSRRAKGSHRFEAVAVDGLPTGSRVQALLQASDGWLWIGTQAGELLRLDPASGQGRRLDEGLPGQARSAVTSLLEAPSGQVWVGRAQGLALRGLDGQLQQLLRHDPRRYNGLAGNHVTTLVRDAAGWVWVGGFGLGLQRHNPGNRALRVRGAEPGAAGAFTDADTRSVLALDNGEVWAASAENGVAVMDAALAVVGALPAPGGASTSTLQVQAMAQAADGSVWLAAGERLHQYSRERQALRSVALPAGPARQLLAAADGTLWIATNDGLHRLDAHAPRPQRQPSLAPGALTGPVHAMALAPDGALWVGSAAGLYLLPAPGQGAQRLVPVAMAPGAGLGNPSVAGLLWDRQGTLWVDTAVTGLHRMTAWDGAQARFERISQRHGVLNRPFGANLLQDRQGRIWSHMHVYDPAADRLNALTAADGARMGTGWFMSYSATPDGRLLFGAAKGLLVVDPEAYAPSAYEPPLVVSELRINGRPLAVDPAARTLRLTPQDRSFSIEFSALDYSDPRQLRYAYQLQGFDPDWISTGAELRHAAYSNLDPGQYRLRVRATNRSGQWSRHELDILVEVAPAWWQHAGTRLAALLATALLVAAWGQWRTRRLRRNEQTLQAMVHTRTADLQALTLALQQESTARLEASLTDPLTGLRNRRYLNLHIDADVALALRRHAGHHHHGEPAPADADLLFFLIDIDHFKQVNDQHGHAAGDAVLVQMRSRLLQVFRDTDHIVRWGGEEFLVVARGSDRRHATDLAERARQAVHSQPFVLPDGQTLARSCSIGFAAFPPSPPLAGPQDWNLTVNAADAALYDVKTRGRNGWRGLLQVQAATLAEQQALLRLPARAWPGEPRLTWASAPEAGGQNRGNQDNRGARAADTDDTAHH